MYIYIYIYINLYTYDMQKWRLTYIMHKRLNNIKMYKELLDCVYRLQQSVNKSMFAAAGFKHKSNLHQIFDAASA